MVAEAFDLEKRIESIGILLCRQLLGRHGSLQRVKFEQFMN